MTFPVLVEQCDGQYAATLVGAPDVRAEKPSRSEALAGLKAEIEKRVEGGKLVSLEVGLGSVSALAGKYRDDPTSRDICREAYETRDTDGTS